MGNKNEMAVSANLITYKLVFKDKRQLGLACPLFITEFLRDTQRVRNFNKNLHINEKNLKFHISYSQLKQKFELSKGKNRAMSLSSALALLVPDDGRIKLRKNRLSN